MPLMWPEQLQTLLPAISKKLLLNQKRKFNNDWSTVSLAFPETSKENYLYNWLIVNTRTFYYLSSTTKKTLPRDDCMALSSFADYFNHVHDGGLEVEFSDKGYTISTNFAIERGEELNISYGNHSNSFLLAEYGFILKDNKWDEVSLDAHILPRLSIKQRDLLREVNFFGKYVLDKSNVCHRTQVALRLLCLPVRTWRQYVEGLQDGQKEQVAVDKILVEVLESHKQEALLALERVSMVTEGRDCQRRTLSTHWKQILQLLDAAIAKIKKMEV